MFTFPALIQYTWDDTSKSKEMTIQEFCMSIFNQTGQTVTNQVNEDRDPWIPVSDYQPKGSPIVFMYSESVNEFSCGHFVLNRAGVPITHWMPCVAPKRLT